MANKLPNRFGTFKEVIDNANAMPDAADVWESIDAVNGLVENERLKYTNVISALEPAINVDFDKSAFESAITSGSCVVTLVGTSITVGTSENENQNTWANRLKRHLELKYPSVDFEFQNLGISGQSLARYADSNFRGLASAPENPSDGYFVNANPDTWPSGSTVGQSWMSAAEATAPDLFILAHGMNDRTYPYVYENTLNTAISDVLSWSKVPSIALVSDMLPVADFSGFQEVSRINDYTRWYAVSRGYGLIDVNRAWKAVRYNIDSVLSNAVRQSSIADWVQSGSESTLNPDSFHALEAANATITKDGDYAGMRFSFNWVPSNGSAAWYVACNILSTGDPDNSCIYIERAGSSVVIRKRPVAGVEQSFATTAPVPATQETWEVRVVRCWIEVYRDRQLLGKFMHRQSTGNGIVSFSQNRASATSIQCDLNEQPQVFPKDVATDVELLGVSGVWVSGDYSTGGNGTSHPSRLAVEKVFDPVIRDFVSKL